MNDSAFTKPVSPSIPKTSYVLGSVIVIALGSMTIASAQSPFANQKKQQAWELPQNTQTQSSPQQRATQQPITQTPTTTQSYPSAAPATTSYSGPYSSQQASQPYTSQPNTTPSQSGYASPLTSQQTAPTPPRTTSPQATPTSNYYYPQPSSSSPTGQSAPPNNSVPQNNNGVYYYGGQSGGHAAPYSNSPYQPASTQTYPAQTYPPQVTRQGPKSWKEKLGLDRISTVFRGFVKGGVGAVHQDTGADSDWDDAYIGDAKAEFEISAITDSGYEYGVNLEGRAQYDKNRRGFGGRVTDCPPTELGCSSAVIEGTPTALRGHTSRFYSFGADDAKESEFALESAHLFLRSAYGDFTIGRDDGAAYLFSLGAPSLLAIGASNSSTDYTGLDSVKTVNDASGFSEKITYTSPRLLGDTVGVGVQIGGSYALNARACGVDYCVKATDVVGTTSPDIEDIFEVGLALDRTFTNGLKMEATATYAVGSEQSGYDAFDDLKSYNVGAEVSWMDVTLGGSFLQSNNGLANGDYQAWDIGATWKPSALGFTLGYGHAKDENVSLLSDQFLAGISYDFDKFTLGAGAQYIERETYGFDGTAFAPSTDKATALFVEGGFKF